jgi:putative cardiolipin synthase
MRYLVLWAVALFTTGCAGLPAGVVRNPSSAIAGSPNTALGRIATVSAPDAALSGFRLLPSGMFALDTRLELARRAQSSLDLQYYLIQADSSGRAFLRAIRDASQRGVRVRLLLDDLYTAGQDALLLGLAAYPNVEVRLFNPFPAGRDAVLTRFATSLFQFERVNHRMHNKLFIADGVMAVTGGRNIADEYFARHPLANFIDLDVFATGAIVPELAMLFDRYWDSPSAFPLASIATSHDTPVELRARFESLTQPEPASSKDVSSEPDVLGYGPIAEGLDKGRLDLIWGQAAAFADFSGPGFGVAAQAPVQADASRVRFNVLEHIRDAKTEVVLTSPYLIPGRKGMELFRGVRERGVSVSILTNSLASTDEPLVHTGYRRYRKELLRLGVELYELSPLKAAQGLARRKLFGVSVGGLHTKALVFDREEVFIGSMNFDPRSDHYNSEMGIIVHSPQLALEALRLVGLAKLQAAHRLRLTPGGDIEWVTPADADDEVHTEEPESGFWTRVLLDLLAPLAPESLL